MKAFAVFKIKNWCTDLPYVDKIANDNNGVSFLLVRQRLFDGTVDSKRMETKDFKDTLRAFLSIFTKKTDPQKFGSKREQHLLESLKH